MKTVESCSVECWLSPDGMLRKGTSRASWGRTLTQKQHTRKLGAWEVLSGPANHILDMSYLGGSASGETTRRRGAKAQWASSSRTTRYNTRQCEAKHMTSRRRSINRTKVMLAVCGAGCRAGEIICLIENSSSRVFSRVQRGHLTRYMRAKHAITRSWQACWRGGPLWIVWYSMAWHGRAGQARALVSPALVQMFKPPTVFRRWGFRGGFRKHKWVVFGLDRHE